MNLPISYLPRRDTITRDRLQLHEYASNYNFKFKWVVLKESDLRIVHKVNLHCIGI